MEITQDLNHEDVEAQLQAWEERHDKITGAISAFVCDFGRMPTYRELAAETGLESAVITKHLEDFTYHPSYGEEIEQLRMMSTRILAKVARLAARGDVNAARLYCDVVAKVYVRPPAPLPDKPDGVVRVKNRNIVSVLIDRITPERRDAIEAILKAPAIPVVAEDVETRNRLWQENHHKMVDAISDYMKKNGRVPTTTQLASMTELSRQTISKHLKEFTSHPVFRSEIEQFRSLTVKVVTTMATLADDGNIKASRLFFKVMTEIFPSLPLPPPEQKWYLVVNQTRLDKELVKHLSPEQQEAILEHIESFDWRARDAEQRRIHLGLPPEGE